MTARALWVAERPGFIGPFVELSYMQTADTRACCPFRSGQEYPMDKNRTEGAKRQLKGTVKEVAGKITGNTSKEVAGKVEKNVGKAQRNIGEAADEARDANRKG